LVVRCPSLSSADTTNNFRAQISSRDQRCVRCAARPVWCAMSVHKNRSKIADLRELGFADPVKMITSNPGILRYAMDNIRAKIVALGELGFAQPVKMITSLPTILGYAIGNIRGKIADLRELGFADPVKMITLFPAILGYAQERVLLCGGIVMGLDKGTDDMFARLIKEPRAVIDAVAAAQPRTWSEVGAIITKAKRIK